MSFKVTTDEKEDIILSLQEEVKKLQECLEVYKEFTDDNERMRLKAEEYIENRGLYKDYEMWLMKKKQEEKELLGCEGGMEF